jgi:4-amino-4-deoxy-L-arabinose transferase-like glycosyltransferase
MEEGLPATDSSANSAETAKRIYTPRSQYLLLRILLELFTTIRGWWLICICVSAIVIWPARNHIITDGLSYLDIASEASSGDLSALGNPYWNPAYPALIGIALFVLRPSAANEIHVVQLVNFIVSVVALGAFTMFFRSWTKTIPEFEQASDRDKGLFTLFAFCCFLWFGYFAIGVTITTPDMLVACQVFSVAALGCRVLRPNAGWKHFAALGVLLGLGIYVKAALFPLAFVFIALLFVSLVRTSDLPLKKIVAFLAITTVKCAVVSAPLIIVMSEQAGHLTTGESGRLNYVWNVDGLKPDLVGWTGGTPPQYGTPLHPPRTLMENPKVLEFATPIPGTYPLWHSPAYWYAGAKPVFDLRKNFLTIRESLLEFKVIATHAIGFIGGAILLFLLSVASNRKTQPWRISFLLLAWPLIACVMYAIVRTQPRYVVAFLLLLCLVTYGALVFRVKRRVAIGVCAVALLIPMTPLVINVAQAFATSIRQFRHPVDEDYVAVAHKLQRLGLQPGDEVALAGFGLNCYYARYDRLRVVAQIISPDDFWRLNPTDAKRVESRLASIGVKALVAMNRPAGNQESGWTDVGRFEGESFSVLLLETASDPSH